MRGRGVCRGRGMYVYMFVVGVEERRSDVQMKRPTCLMLFGAYKFRGDGEQVSCLKTWMAAKLWCGLHSLQLKRYVFVQVCWWH